MNKLSQNSRYRILCKLYKQYRASIKFVKHKYVNGSTLDIKVDNVNCILQEIEKFPISWEFYVKQNFKFSSDFENLIVFISE